MWNVRRRSFARIAVFAAFGVTIVAAMAFGRVIDRLVAAGIDGPAGLVRRVAAVGHRYGSRPLETFAPPDAPGLPRLARWLNTCTAEHSRVAVLGFEPQIMVLAERGFAGGMAFFDVAWFGSDADQRVTLERWSRQDVPAVLAMESEWGSFSRDYALVRAHVDREYHVAQRSSFGGTKDVRVFIKRSASPVGVEHTTGLPCFR